MIRVSIVEDKEEVRRSLVRNIDRTEGMIVVSDYRSAEEALENIPVQKPDVVLMDIGLPRMNGIECMIRLQLQSQQMDFLMFTVFADDENVFEALKAGALGYVLKSEGTRGAIKALKEYQEGGAPMSREIARKVLVSFNQKNKLKNNSFESLTKQQRIILEQIVQGLLNKEIASRLGISENTVKQHNNAIYKKLQVNNRTEAVKKYLEGQL
ncbi:MAG: response regulator transcription factor [Bacteroidota bacterium]